MKQIKSEQNQNGAVSGYKLPTLCVATVLIKQDLKWRFCVQEIETTNNEKKKKKARRGRRRGKKEGKDDNDDNNEQGEEERQRQ